MSEITKPDHDYEPGDEYRPMYTDPMCRICGRPAKEHQ